MEDYSLSDDARQETFVLNAGVGGLRHHDGRMRFAFVPAGTVLKILNTGSIAGTVEVSDGVHTTTVFMADLVERSERLHAAPIRVAAGKFEGRAP